MTDGKKALEDLVAGLDGVTPFEDRDMMRYEHGGGRLAIIRDGQRHLVADLYHEADREHFLRCSPDRIRAIATDFAALEARAIAAEERVKEATELQFRAYLGIAILKTVLKKAKLESGVNVASELLKDIATANPEFPARSSLRAALAGDKP